MNAPATIHSIEARLKAAGVPLARVLTGAGINRSTWTRWRSSKVQPRLDHWSAALAAAEMALSERGERS